MESLSLLHLLLIVTSSLGTMRETLRNFQMKDSLPAGTKKVLTLVYILRGEDPSGQEVLLGLKKRGFGCGKWNGFGGKVDADETVPEAAVREVQEECGLTVRQEDLVDVGTLDFEFVGDPVHLEVHVFETRQFSGDPKRRVLCGKFCCCPAHTVKPFRNF